jgi:hypothetical protein
VLTRYAVERFLYRLSRSPHAERFVLKGAVTLAPRDARGAGADRRRLHKRRFPNIRLD